ncbi:MAG: Autotransporter-associated beta strand repeat-containing protein, partial [Verrucomicrobia bacterium]
LKGGTTVSLVKTGTGTLNLSGANELAGTVDVQGGSLLVNGAGLLSTGSLQVRGGALVNLATSQTVGLVTLAAGQITGSSLTSTAGYQVVSGSIATSLNGSVGLTKTGASSTVVLNAANYYSGDTTVADGTLKLGVANALGTGKLLVNAGVLSLGSSQQAVGALTLNGGTIEGESAAGLTATAFNLVSGNVGAALKGAGSLVKTGIGSVTLSGANDLTGLMDIQGGSLALAGAGALSKGGLSLSNGAVADLGGTSQTVGAVTLVQGILQNGVLTGSTYDLRSGASSAVLSGAVELTKTTNGLVTLSEVNTYTGVTTVAAGTLFTSVGALGKTARINISGGSLAAADYNTNASLNVQGTGVATIRGSGLAFAGSLTNASSVAFTATTGTITLGSLAGAGNTSFGSNAIIAGAGISEGNVSVSGSLKASISGGSVTAAALDSASISGGGVRVSGNASVTAFSGGTLAVGNTGTFGTVSGGQLDLNGARASIGTLNGAQITLGGSVPSAVTLTVESGQNTGTILGKGTLVKSGAGSLTLQTSLGADVALRVDGGTLSSSYLLNPSGNVSVGLNGILALKLNSGVTNYTGGIQSNLGNVLFTGDANGSILKGSSVALPGAFTLGNYVTLDLSTGAERFAESSKITLLGGGSLALGKAEVVIQDILMLGSGTFTLSGNGAKILYTNKPLFLDDSDNVKAGSGVIATGVSFGADTVGGPVGGGTYQFSTGSVLERDAQSAALIGGTLTGKLLKLEPQNPGTTISIRPQAVNFSEGIIAGGSGAFGTVSIGTLAYTSLLTIKSGVTVVLETPGQLKAGLEVGAGASRVSDSGTLEVVGGLENKTVANEISGTGILKKTGSGLVSFTGNNAAFAGTTDLNGGVFEVASKGALGTSGLKFTGGSLRFANVLGGSLAVPGGVAVQAAEGSLVDTDVNTIALTGNLSGAGALNKAGNGTLVLAGSNTAFTGAITAQSGTLQVGDYAQGGALSGTSNLVVNESAIMRIARSGTTNVSQTLSGAGTFEQAGTGSTVLSANNRGFSGAVKLKAGALVLAAVDALGAVDLGGDISFQGGVLQYGTAVATDYSGRFSKVNGQQIQVDTNGNNVNFAATLSGSSTTLWKGGAGELVLSGARNSYEGVTTVQAGTLRLVGEQLGKSAIDLKGGRLVYEIAGGTAAGSVVTAANTSTVFSVSQGTATFTGALSGTGNVIKEGAGLLNVTQSLGQTGGFILNAGTFKLFTPSEAAAKISIGGALTLNAGILDISGGLLNANTILSGGSASTLKLSAATMFVNSVSLDGLNFQITDGGQDVTIFTDLAPTRTAHAMVGGGTVQFKQYSAATLDAADFKGQVENPGNLSKLAFSGTSDVVFRNNLALSGSLQTAVGSNVSFSKDITVAGAVQLAGGTVAVTGGTLRATNDAPVEVGGGATLALSGTQTAVVAAKVQLSAGSITVSNDALKALQGVTTLEVGTSNGSASDAQLVLGGGTGSMTLGAAQTLKGSGTIRGNIKLNDESSTFSPGNSPGKLLVAGSLDFTSGTVEIEVGKTVQDQITVGTLNVVSIGSLATLRIVDYDPAL